MATITATVQNRAGVGQANYVIIVGESNSKNVTTNGSGVATWTVDAGYKGQWAMRVEDASGNDIEGGIYGVAAGSSLLFEVA